METDRVKCNQCDWQGYDSELTPFKEDGKFGDGYGGYGCPNCKTDEYLMDIEEPEKWLAVTDSTDKDGNPVWDVEFRDNDGGGMIATINNCRADLSKDIAERIASLPDIEQQKDELLKDYDGAITKFDNCRGCLARTLEKLGIDPNNCPEDMIWHEWLIEQLDSANITKDNPDS